MSSTAVEELAGTGHPNRSHRKVPGIPMTRLIRVELRKMIDTRAGLWLMIATAALSAGIIVVLFVTQDADARTMMAFTGASASPQAVMLPILGILLVTSEWGQRTVMVTFTLTANRKRVLVAKVAAAILVGLIALVGSLAVAALAAAVGGASDPWQHITGAMIAKFALLEVSSILLGLGFGMALLNSPFAVTLYLVLPNMVTLLGGFWSGMDKLAPWIDLGNNQSRLYSGPAMTGDNWIHLGVSAALWILLPVCIGVVRVLRTEVK